MKFLLSELAAQLDGTLAGPDNTVDGVATDSRSIEADGRADGDASGPLFVPLIAERDGHDFIDVALAHRCGGYLTSQPPRDGSAVLVADTTEALTEIGRIARTRLGPHIIGVTGSVGKTSVKDMILAACAESLRTHANVGSFNNEVGLPLTLANAPNSTEVTITEMGARGIGHVAHLCEIAAPTVGVVTAVALAHSELFGTIEAVAQAKGELVEALPASGTAVLNADDPRVAAMATRTRANVISYGLAGDVRPTELTFDEMLRPRFTIRTPLGDAEVSLGVSGQHMALNAAAAIATAIAVGAPLEAAVAGLVNVKMSPWRMEIDKAPSGMLVINDSYNANPTSMRAALATLKEVDASSKVAFVGTMGELGEEGAEEHLNIAAEAKAAGIVVVAIAAEAYGADAEHVASIEEAASYLAGAGAGHAVLIKASRSAGLERLAERLLAA